MDQKKQQNISRTYSIISLTYVHRKTQIYDRVGPSRMKSFHDDCMCGTTRAPSDERWGAGVEYHFQEI